MRIARLGPTSAVASSRWMGGMICAFFLFILLAASCAATIHAQQTAAPSSPASTKSLPADDHAAEDTLDTTPPTDETEDGSNPNPAQPPIVVAPRLKPSPGDVSEAAADPPIPVPASAGGDAQRQQINNECANLLFLSRTLRAEVEKTNMNELSVPVVRNAGQIEQLARKMRDEMKPVLSSTK